MINSLVRFFIKDSENIDDAKVRTAYGTFSGIVGIVCNVLLFLGKFLVGTLSNSVAIIADAVNNLTDASSSVISLVGFKLADKKADAEHPYGHARYEYLAGLCVCVMILVIGVELLGTGIDKVLHPEAVETTAVTVAVLILSILMKLWMCVFNTKLGNKIRSNTLLATAQDSRNDVIATSAVLVTSLVSKYTGVDTDGWVGIAVAVFILYSGIVLIKDTIDPILGKSPDPELVGMIQKKILAYPGVISMHDLMVHDYGPCRQFASVHVEMPAEDDVLLSHEIIDNIERDFLREDNIFMVVHYDPVVTNDERVTEMKAKVAEVVRTVDEALTIHDFRIVPGVNQGNMIFDCVVPHKFYMTKKELKKELCERIKEVYPEFFCVITIEESFVAE